MSYITKVRNWLNKRLTEPFQDVILDFEEKVAGFRRPSKWREAFRELTTHPETYGFYITDEGTLAMVDDSVELEDIEYEYADSEHNEEY